MYKWTLPHYTNQWGINTALFVHWQAWLCYSPGLWTITMLGLERQQTKPSVGQTKMESSCSDFLWWHRLTLVPWGNRGVSGRFYLQNSPEKPLPGPCIELYYCPMKTTFQITDYAPRKPSKTAEGDVRAPLPIERLLWEVCPDTPPSVIRSHCFWSFYLSPG